MPLYEILKATDGSYCRNQEVPASNPELIFINVIETEQSNRIGN